MYVTPTVLRAGEPVQMNVMPADASVWLDVRTVPGVDHEALAAEVGERARQAGKPDRRGRPGRDVIDDRPPSRSPPTTRWCGRCAPPTRRSRASRPASAASPARPTAPSSPSHGGVPSVVYGPGGKWIAHQADEFVEVDDIVRCAEVFAAAARLLPRPLMWEALVPIGPGPANAITDVCRLEVGPLPPHR